MRREAVAPVVSLLAALFATSHHWLHMLLIALGVSFASLGFMADPLARRAMLGVALTVSL